MTIHYQRQINLQLVELGTSALKYNKYTFIIFGIFK